MISAILNKKQLAAWPLILKFKKNYGLVGGTAIALQLKHRRSIDFDLFSTQKIDSAFIRRQIVGLNFKISQVLVDTPEEYTVITNGVKCTFLHYPFPIQFNIIYQKMPLADLKTLAAMKAYALGRRAKWKDYVDILFITEYLNGLASIIKKAKKIFGKEFNDKIFREQLVYFKDIDYSEEIEYLPGYELNDQTVKKSLQKLAVTLL